LKFKQLGASDPVIGLAPGASSVAGLVLAVRSGYLLDRFDVRRVLVVSTFGLAVTTGAFVLVSTIGWMILQGFFQMWVWLVLQQMMTRVGVGPDASRQLSLFLQRIGLSLGLIGALLSTIGASSLLVRPFLPAMIRRLGLIKPLIWSTWTAIVCVAMTPLCFNITLVVIGVITMGAGPGANPPITINLLAGAESDAEASRWGLRTVANRSAQVLQPIVYGTIASFIGIGVAFPISGSAAGCNRGGWAAGCPPSRTEPVAETSDSPHPPRRTSAGARCAPQSCVPRRSGPRVRDRRP
jgi:hypothetical protein